MYFKTPNNTDVINKPGHRACIDIKLCAVSDVTRSDAVRPDYKKRKDSALNQTVYTVLMLAYADWARLRLNSFGLQYEVH